MNHTIRSTVFNRGSPTAKSTWVLNARDSEGRSRFDFMGELYTNTSPHGYEISDPKFVWFCTNVPVRVSYYDPDTDIGFDLDNVMTYCSSLNGGSNSNFHIKPMDTTDLVVSLHCICIAANATTQGGG